MNDLTKISLLDLFDILDKASAENNQELINKIALEIARRWYYPKCGKTRQQFLEEFGYKKINKERGKIKIK